MDPVLEQRRPKGKKRRRRDIITNHLQLYAELKPRDLRGVLIDASVWLCAEDDVVHTLDSLCFGNLDGGVGTATAVREQLEGEGRTVLGTKSVRLSIDEAFFMSHALEILQVHALVDGRSVLLSAPALWQRLRAARPDFVTLYLAYHHFRSKVGSSSHDNAFSGGQGAQSAPPLRH